MGQVILPTPCSPVMERIAETRRQCLASLPAVGEERGLNKSGTLPLVLAACSKLHQQDGMRGARVIGTLCALFIASLLAFTQSGAIASSPQGKVLIIDGAKNPEKFPEWYIWEFTFRTLSTMPDSVGRQSLSSVIGVSADEMALLRKEVKEHFEREAELGKFLKQTRADLTKAGLECGPTAFPLTSTMSG